MALPEKRTCGTMEEHRRLSQVDRVYRQNRLKIEEFSLSYVWRFARSRTNLPRVTIPIVVHVVYRNENENISLEQIQSQIDSLNLIFARLMKILHNSHHSFSQLLPMLGLIFDSQCATLTVAQPMVSPVLTLRLMNFTRSRMKLNIARRGGHDAWSRDKYLNVWVASNITWASTTKLLGYAQFPGGPANTDGVVIDTYAFGTIGTVEIPFNYYDAATGWPGL